MAKESSECKDLSLSSNCDYDLTSLSSSSKDAESVGITPLNVSIGNFAIAKVYSFDFSKNFITKVVIGPDADNDYEVKFMKLSNKVKNGFIFTKIDNIAFLSYNDITCVLPFVLIIVVFLMCTFVLSIILYGQYCLKLV